MAFEISIPSNLTFTDYITIIQVARSWADGYDRKDAARLRASLAPTLTVDYRSVMPPWGTKEYAADAFVAEWLSPQHLGLAALATQHLLGQPFFESVSEEMIVVAWQQVAAHGRWVAGRQEGSPGMGEIGEVSDGHSYMHHTFLKVEGKWRISVVKPEVLFQTGDFRRIRRQED